MTTPEDLPSFRADLPGPTPDSWRLARARLEQAIAARTGTAPAPRRTRPGRVSSRRVWGLRAGAIIAAVASLTVAALVTPWARGPARPDTAAAAVLDRAADSARRNPVAVPGTGQFLYIRIRARWANTDVSSGVTYLQDQLVQTWAPTGGTGTAVQHNTYGKATYLRPGDAARLSRGSRPSAPGQISTFSYQTVDGSFADPSENFTAGLPVDIDQLYARIRSDAGGDNGEAGQRMLVDVGNVLGYSVASPALRSALYQVVTRIPGVRLVGDTTDYAGRRGTTVAITAGGDEQDLIFDTSTGQLLGQREVATTSRPGIPAGTVIGWSSFQTALVTERPTP